ncbi:AAA family ATPase [Crocosphaera sp. UHCC 0190]|uniref:ATP-binding protein n=1 Tax=Crocosphaera sp. UHCC 0190 TaxID=3110246 RepID=UPI002B20EABA|nr:AAA family ATPase [Crocosphaera sp. UHCC 0190]MEA5512402.1 AAA family ATPase [Crocosphaera sp. UHCC 0190]
MYTKPILPLLQTYQSLCLQSPLIERTNVLNWLVSLGHTYFRWHLAFEQFQSLSEAQTWVDLEPNYLLFETDLSLESTENTLNIKEILLTWQQTHQTGILIIENGLQLIQQQSLNILLIEVLNNLKGTDKYLIFLETEGESLKGELTSIIPVLMLPIPTIKDLENLAQQLGLETASLLPGLGLCREEICQGVRLAQATETPITQALFNYKIERFQALGLALNPTPSTIEVGGMDLLKEAISHLQLDYSPQARLRQIPLPKGWLLAGPPGTGKSFVAKLIANRLQFALVTVGIDKIKAHGAVYLSNLLSRLEAAAPLVCYFDEFDKFFEAEGKGEESKTREVLGVLLTWLQEKKSSVFVLATLNRLDALPPELTRAGRFDKIFYVGFPQAIERKAIFELHAARFDPKFQDKDGRLTMEQWQILLNQTNFYTGAEIQFIVENAARQCFYNGQSIELTLEDLLAAKQKIIPLFSRDTERVLAMANRAKGVCEPVSSPDSSIFAPASVNLWGEAN